MSYCGLDFGTSNSAIGIVQDGQVQLCPLEMDQVTMPTALFYHHKGRCSFGREAVSDYLNGEQGRLMRSIKSILGTSLMEETTPLKGVKYAFKSVMSDYIGMLKSRTEKWSGQRLDYVVQGRPVRFAERDGPYNQQAEDTLKSILRDAGFTDVIFQYEPVAAAQCLVRDTGGEGIALVIDMGGGTTDFTVIDLDQITSAQELPESSILTSYGIRLGGTNFDKTISLAKVMPELGQGITLEGPKGLSAPNWLFQMLATWSEVNFLYARNRQSDIEWVIRNGADKNLMKRLEHVIKNEYGHEICHDVEVAKMNLSTETLQSIDLGYIENDLKIQVGDQELSDILSPEIEAFKLSILETLKTCTLKTSQVDIICLTGGSTNLLSVKQAITEIFPHCQIIEQDKFSSVCRGLTLNAMTKFP